MIFLFLDRDPTRVVTHVLGHSMGRPCICPPPRSNSVVGQHSCSVIPLDFSPAVKLIQVFFYIALLQVISFTLLINPNTSQSPFPNLLKKWHFHKLLCFFFFEDPGLIFALYTNAISYKSILIEDLFILKKD